MKIIKPNILTPPAPAAQPDLLAQAIRCISVRGPDGDGLVWIVCTMPNGNAGAISVASDRIAARVFTAWRDAAQKALDAHPPAPADDIVRRLRMLHDSRKLHPSGGAHGQVCGMEMWRIVASGDTLSVLDEAADAIAALRAENARLVGEVANRNQRALDGDNAVKRWDEQYARAERAELAGEP